MVYVIKSATITELEEDIKRRIAEIEPNLYQSFMKISVKEWQQIPKFKLDHPIYYLLLNVVNVRVRLDFKSTK